LAKHNTKISIAKALIGADACVVVGNVVLKKVEVKLEFLRLSGKNDPHSLASLS